MIEKNRPYAVIMEDDIMFMIHYFSKGMYGKGNEIEADADFTKQFYRGFYKKIYKHFLTDKEIQNVIDGKDYYFNQLEVEKRLKRKIKKLGKLKTITKVEK